MSFRCLLYARPALDPEEGYADVYFFVVFYMPDPAFMHVHTKYHCVSKCTQAKDNSHHECCRRISSLLRPTMPARQRGRSADPICTKVDSTEIPGTLYKEGDEERKRMKRRKGRKRGKEEGRKRGREERRKGGRGEETKRGREEERKRRREDFESTFLKAHFESTL